MFILDFIFRNKPWLIKKTINDDTFGLMWFNKDQDPVFDHFQAHITFRPTNSEIDVFIDSDKNGIDPRQKTFFKEIETKYSECIRKSIRPIEEFLKNKNNQNTQITNFEEEFTLIIISIPRDISQKWSLSFSSEKYSLYDLTINFIKWDIIEIA